MRLLKVPANISPQEASSPPRIAVLEQKMRRHHAAREVAVALAVLLALVARPDSVLATGDTARIENAGAAKENASPAPSGETHRTAPVALPKPVSLQTTTDPFRSSTVQLTEGRL